jgi:hypothetical protein
MLQESIFRNSGKDSQSGVGLKCSGCQVPSASQLRSFQESPSDLDGIESAKAQDELPRVYHYVSGTDSIPPKPQP